MASGVMIYGMSFLYGFSGTLTFADPAFGLSLEQAPNGLLVIGVVLTFIGFFFKAGAAPMHIWYSASRRLTSPRSLIPEA